MDHKFIKVLSRLDPQVPGSSEAIYNLLISSLRSLGFDFVCVISYTDSLEPKKVYGDEALASGVESFQWCIRRDHMSGGDTLFRIPVVFGYAPPIQLCVIYSREKHWKKLPSVLSIIRLLYYFIRCSSVELALSNKDRFLTQLVQYQSKGSGGETDGG